MYSSFRIFFALIKVSLLPSVAGCHSNAILTAFFTSITFAIKLDNRIIKVPTFMINCKLVANNLYREEKPPKISDLLVPRRP